MTSSCTESLFLFFKLLMARKGSCCSGETPGMVLGTVVEKKLGKTINGKSEIENK